MKEYSYEPSKEAEFHEAWTKNKRIDDLQQQLNQLTINLFAFDMNYKKYNYETFFNLCNTLFLECAGKLSPELRKKGLDFRERIKNIIKKHNPITFDKNKQKTKTNSYARYIEEFLFAYHLFIKDCLEKSGFAGPSKQDSRGAMLG